MKIYSWNVNGMRAVVRKGSWQAFLASHDPDVICLQETKAEKEQAGVDLNGYHEYWNSAQKKGYSGTALFSKIEPKQVLYGFPCEIAERYLFVDSEGRDSTGEGRVIAAEYERFWLLNVYTPNAKDDLSRLPLREKEWDPAFLAYAKFLERTKPVILCGDLNVAHTPDDLARPKENVGNKGFTEEERQGFQRLIDAGFIDSFRLFTKGNGHYTWWSPWANARPRNVGWRIDYFLISPALQPFLAKAMIHADVLGSDHCPVSIEVDGQ